MTRRLARMGFLVVLAATWPVPPAAMAQDTRLAVQPDDTVKSVLGRQVGKRVTLVLPNGPEMTGVVVTVGDTVVHLSELSGREFSDAVVPLDRVVAVVVRVRGR